MQAAAVHEIDRLLRQVDRLERENQHLREMISDQADRLVKRDRIILDQHKRLTMRSDRW